MRRTILLASTFIFIRAAAAFDNITSPLQLLSGQLNELTLLIQNKHEADMKKIEELQKRVSFIDQQLADIDNELETISETRKKLDRELDETLPRLAAARNARDELLGK